MVLGAVLGGCTTPTTSAVEQRGIVEAGIEPTLDADIIPFDLAMSADGGLTLDVAVPIDAPTPNDATITDAPLADAPLMDASFADAPLADAPLADAPPADAPLADAPLADAPPTDAPGDGGSTDDGGVGDGGTGTGDGGYPARDALDPQFREMESFYACGDCSAGGDPLTALGPGLVVLGLVLRRRRPR